MHIKIKIHGHQHYREIAGEVVAWGQTVEKFGDAHMQVPCVTVIDGKNDVHTVSLKEELRWTEVTIETPNAKVSGAGTASAGMTS